MPMLKKKPQQYIALLRGINVGGNNKISMPELRAAFEKEGYTSVTTYINSGNVLFVSDAADASVLREKCAALIRRYFHLDITVCIILADDLLDAINHAPPWWSTNKHATHNALFVIPPALAVNVCEEFGAIKPEYEQVFVYGSIIFWSVAHEGISKARWAKIAGTSAIKNVTIRNANTTVKLAQLVQDQRTAGTQLA